MMINIAEWTNRARKMALLEAATLTEELVEFPAGHNGNWEGYGRIRTTRNGAVIAQLLRERAERL